MMWANSCDYCDPYILLDGNITITGNGSDDVAKTADERDNGIIFENYVSVTEFISDINNAQKDNTKDTDVVMLIYNFKKYSEYNKVKDTINYLRKQEVYDNIMSDKFMTKQEVYDSKSSW